MLRLYHTEDKICLIFKIANERKREWENIHAHIHTGRLRWSLLETKMEFSLLEANYLPSVRENDDVLPVLKSARVHTHTDSQRKYFLQ